MPAVATMSNWDFLIAVIYVAGTIVCGFYFARRQTSSEEYFLGGRGFGWFPIALSMVATLVSTTSFLAYPSEAYEHSMTIVCYIIGVPPALLLVQKVFIPFYRRQNLTSIYGYVETAVGMSCRICIFGTVAEDQFAYEPFIAAWYDVLHELPREGPALEQAMRDVGGALVEDGIDPQTGYFHVYRTPDGIAGSETLLAWAGVLQIARPLIRVGKMLNEPRFVQTAADMVDRSV